MLDKREVLGFVVAPLPVLAPLIVMSVVVLATTMPLGLGVALDFATLLLLGYFATILLGLPIHLWLRTKNERSASAYIVWTLCAVMLLAAIVVGLETAFSNWQNDNPFAFSMWSETGIALTLAFASAACLTAILFWAIAVRRPKN